MRLIIKPGGRLVLEKWHYDSDTDHGDYIEIDKTDKISLYLFYPPCEIGDGVTLGDIITLIERNLDFWKVAVNRWVEEFITESKQPTNPDTKIDYLELYNVYEIDEGTFDNLPFPSFHGVSKDTNWGLSFSKVNNLVHLPVKLGGVWVYDNGIEDIFERQVLECDKFVCSLGQIIAGIFHELSWNGSPEDRDKRFEDLCDRRDEIIGET